MNKLNPFDRSSFEQFFGGKLPFVSADNDKPMAWVESFVQDTLQKALPRSFAESQPLRTETFETHHYVIVKWHIPRKTDPYRLRVSASPSQLKLEGLPEQLTHIVRLPSPVNPSICRALYKDGLLQVKLRKRSRRERFRDVYIRID